MKIRFYFKLGIYFVLDILRKTYHILVMKAELEQKDIYFCYIYYLYLPFFIKMSILPFHRVHYKELCNPYKYTLITHRTMDCG
jgi:hypothetical protein